MQDIIKILFSLLRSAISGELLPESEKAAYTDGTISRVMSIAKAHDVSHLIAVAVDINDLPGKEVVRNALIAAIYRYEKLDYSYKTVCESLEKAQIQFIPLKGSIIRKYYREPWLRTSCDIDILIHKEDLERAASHLVEDVGFTRGEYGPHDVSLYTQNKMHVELHYDLVEDNRANNASEVLRTVWDTAKTSEDHIYCYEMPDEMFYFYHIAHMAKHFENGGCGIRPFIDLWILDNIDNISEEKRDELLRRGRLAKFAEASRALSRVWFENAEHTEITRQAENYIVRGGVYGSTENRVTVQQKKKGGRVRYLFSRIFLPYNTLKLFYPIIQKHRWLTPFMQMRRWFKLLFRGRVRRAVKELSYNNNISVEEAEAAQLFLRNIGL